ncbi:MAG: hypothetical protein E7510_08245 [Ruminococcus sp.]|nr:hypothetical protein [Ruminococcus sp.]
MKKEIRKVASALACIMAVSSVNGIGGVTTKALDPEAVLKDDLNELQQTIVDYIFIKNYIAKNVVFSDEFKATLDYNGDGTVNVIDLTKAKNKILKLSGVQDPDTTTTSVTTVTTTEPTTTSVTTTEPTTTSSTTTTTEQTTTTPVTTVTVPTTTTPVQNSESSLKVGDVVKYKGKAYFRCDGKGNVVDANGTYKVVQILSGSYPYTVQLENLGWVSYKDLTGKEQSSVTTTTTVTTTSATTTTTTTPVTTTTVTTTPVTTTVASALKVGDKVSYKGKVYGTSGGKGNTIEVNGVYKVVQIISGNYPYTVQLENVGWVSYKDLTGQTQPAVTTTAVTTTPATTTTATTTTAARVLKVGDKVSYKGKVYGTSGGKGNTIEVNGVYKVVQIISGNYPYTVQLENVGWVSYKDLTGQTQPAVTTTAVTTTPATTTTATTTTAARVLKVGDTVNYTGQVRYQANGNGRVSEVSGSFVIQDIIIGTQLEFNVQLKNAGWVRYSDLTGKTSSIASIDNFNGNTYRIKNAASGKYITIGGTSNNSNVYQYSLLNNTTQNFKIEKYYNTENFRVYAVFAGNKVIDIVKDSNKNVVSGCNVQIYDAVDPDAQLWNLVYVGNGMYSIASSKNSEVVLTASGFSDGSATGKTTSSAGNIYISKYENRTDQQWFLEKVN